MGTELVMEFGELEVEAMGSLLPCRMKLTESGATWKQTKTGKLETLGADELLEVVWTRLGNRPALKLVHKNLAAHRFAGFREEDLDKLRPFAKTHWDRDIDTEDVCVKGWNYGKASFDNAALSLRMDGRTAFEVPLKYVSECNAAKSEVGLAFHQNDDCSVALTDLRFHVPTDPDDESGVDPVEDFRKAVLRFAGIVDDDDRKPICSFPQLFCNTPRGKYDFNVFPSHLSLHGKTYDFKIPADSILRMFLLKHKDNNHEFFVVAMDPPLRQGQTRYPFLVLEFTNDEELEISLNLTDKQMEETYKGKLQREMSGPTYEVFCRVVRTVFKQKITVPGSFLGSSGTPAISCAFKQAAGFLYPLEKGFVFVHKPPMYIRFDEVASVHFARSDQSTKSFDFEVEARSGHMYPFSGIEKEEYTKFYDFCQKKGMKIRGSKMGGAKAKKGGGFSDSEEEDAELDPYKERLKKEARQREEEDDDDQESSEDDSDYNPEQEIAMKKKKKEELKAKGDSSDSYDTGSDSEPDLEYDSEAGSTSSSGSSESSPDDEDEAATKKPKKPRTAGPRKPRGDKKKKKKDPNAPKKPMSAYFLWLNEVGRAEIKASLGEKATIGEIGKEAGERWKLISASEDKAQWDAKAAKDKERYHKEMETYKPPSDLEDDDQPSSSNKASKSAKRSPTKATSSPKKNVKSKEFVSDDSSSDDDKPKGKGKGKAKASPAASDKDSDKDSEKAGSGKGSDGSSSDEPLSKAAKDKSSTPDSDDSD